MNKPIVVNMADIRVSNDPGVVLMTHALGSCIAVIIYDSTKRIGGMIHYMLPLSSVSQERAKEKPVMFADTGIPILFDKMHHLGCHKDSMVVKVAGGGNIYGSGGVDLGTRNYAASCEILEQHEMIMAAKDVGGARSRIASLYVDNGRVTIKSKGKEVDL